MTEAGHHVVVGCGRVGAALAAELVDLGHTVAVVDKDAAAFDRLRGLDVRTVAGFGFDRDVLDHAGIRGATGLAAVTSGDNSNILVARLGREVYDVPNVVARIYDPRRAALYERLGIPTVATVAWTTDQAMRRLLPGETRATWIDPTGAVAVVQRPVPVAWIGRPYLELEDAAAWRCLSITRNGGARVATGADVAQEGDLVTLALPVGDLDRFEPETPVAGGHR